MVHQNQHTFAINAEVMLIVSGSCLAEARKHAENIFREHLRGGGFDLSELPPGVIRARVLVDDSSLVEHVEVVEMGADEPSIRIASEV